MSELTVEQQEAAAKETAALYNSQNPDNTGDAAENEARQAAAAAKLAGNKDHNGAPAVIEDTPEELAAIAEKKAKEEAEAAEKAEKEAYDALSPEEKAEADKKAKEEAAAAHEAKVSEHKDAEWITSDNAEFNAAINLMKAGGMEAAEASAIFETAANTGDLSTVDREALVEAIGEDQAALVMAGFTRYVETTGQVLLQKAKNLHDAVGGSENWSKMTQWARKEAATNPEMKAKVLEITEAINSDNSFIASSAAKEFAAMYNASPKNNTLEAKVAQVDVTGKLVTPAAPTVTPLTARVYSEGVEDANRTMSGAALNARLAELSKGRQAGRQAGL